MQQYRSRFTQSLTFSLSISTNANLGGAKPRSEEIDSLCTLYTLIEPLIEPHLVTMADGWLFFYSNEHQIEPRGVLLEGGSIFSNHLDMGVYWSGCGSIGRRGSIRVHTVYLFWPSSCPVKQRRPSGGTHKYIVAVSVWR